MRSTLRSFVKACARISKNITRSETQTTMTSLMLLYGTSRFLNVCDYNAQKLAKLASIRCNFNIVCELRLRCFVAFSICFIIDVSKFAHTLLYARLCVHVMYSTRPYLSSLLGFGPDGRRAGRIRQVRWGAKGWGVLIWFHPSLLAIMYILCVCTYIHEYAGVPLFPFEKDDLHPSQKNCSERSAFLSCISLHFIHFLFFAPNLKTFKSFPFHHSSFQLKKVLLCFHTPWILFFWNSFTAVSHQARHLQLRSQRRIELLTLWTFVLILFFRQRRIGYILIHL